MSREDRKRMLSEMKQDPDYAKSRNWLLWGSTICAVCLALSSLMMLRGMLGLEQMVAIIGAISIVYFYLIIRLVKDRNAAETRWWMIRNTKKENKKKRR